MFHIIKYAQLINEIHWKAILLELLLVNVVQGTDTAGFLCPGDTNC